MCDYRYIILHNLKLSKVNTYMIIWNSISGCCCILGNNFSTACWLYSPGWRRYKPGSFFELPCFRPTCCRSWHPPLFYWCGPRCPRHRFSHCSPTDGSGCLQGIKYFFLIWWFNFPSHLLYIKKAKFLSFCSIHDRAVSLPRVQSASSLLYRGFVQCTMGCVQYTSQWL